MSRDKTPISPVDQKAADWFTLINANPEVDEDQLVAFMDWLEQSDEHREAYERTELLWQEMSLVETEFSSAANSTGFAANFGRWGIGLAAALLVAAVSYLLLIPAADVEEVMLQTAIGEQRTLRLPDGSEIGLNTNTRIRAAFGVDARRVYLDRGEAYFTVTKQPGRPFVVMVAGSEVRALGTAFNVRLRRGQQVTVSLAEGRLAVVPLAGGQQSILEPGRQITFRSGDKAVQLEDADLDAVTQWRRGILNFADVPLSEVIAEINRYIPTPLVLPDGETGKERIEAYFQVDNLDSFLNGLDQLLGIQSERRGDRIVLRKTK